jgi:hypothetical protein
MVAAPASSVTRIRQNAATAAIAAKRTILLPRDVPVTRDWLKTLFTSYTTSRHHAGAFYAVFRHDPGENPLRES